MNNGSLSNTDPDKERAGLVYHRTEVMKGVDPKNWLKGLLANDLDNDLPSPCPRIKIDNDNFLPSS